MLHTDGTAAAQGAAVTTGGKRYKFSHPDSEQHTLTVGPTMLDPVLVDDVCIHLEPQVKRILLFAAARAGTTVTKEMLLNDLYGGADEPGQKVIDVFVCKLRKALKAASNGGTCLDTVWGRGYLFSGEEVR